MPGLPLYPVPGPPLLPHLKSLHYIVNLGALTPLSFALRLPATYGIVFRSCMGRPWQFLARELACSCSRRRHTRQPGASLSRCQFCVAPSTASSLEGFCSTSWTQLACRTAGWRDKGRQIETAKRDEKHRQCQRTTLTDYLAANPGLEEYIRLPS